MSQTQTLPGKGTEFSSSAMGQKPAALAATAAVGIVHDLGNLIQIASSAVNIVARNPNVRTADLDAVLDGAKSSLERAGALVRQTIGAARERGATCERVNVEVCLLEIEALVHTTWERAFGLDVYVEQGLPDIACESLGLQNAVLNLLLNARDAMPNGGVIAIRAKPVSLQSGDGVEISVTDRGVGMTPDTIARAFDPFFTTKADGLGGVGLPMVERFAQEAGGGVIIESEYGVGTTVRLQFPAASEPDARRP